MERHHQGQQYNYNNGMNEQFSSSTNNQRSSRSGGGRKSPPPRYSSLTPDFDIGPPSSKTYSSYAPMSSEPNPASRTRKSMYSNELPPSYESSVSPTHSPSLSNNNNMMESKRREYLQQKLTHLKKQNTTSLEHFNIVREDVRQSKEMMEKQIMQTYGMMKQRLESLLQDSLRTLQDIENDMTEPLDTKIDQLKKNMRSIDMTESVLSRQPYSDSVKEKVDLCLKTNIPPFSSDIDICKLTDQNTFSLLRASAGFLADSNGLSSMKQPTSGSGRVNQLHNMDKPRYEQKYESREKDLKEFKYSEPSSKYKEREKPNTRNIPPSFDNFDDDSKSDVSLNNDYEYPRNYNSKEKKQTIRRISPDFKDDKSDRHSISDSVIASYQQLEDLYSQTKNFAVFKGTNF